MSFYNFINKKSIGGNKSINENLEPPKRFQIREPLNTRP